MKKIITLEQSDLDALHDVVLSSIGKKLSNEELLKVWNELPEDIQDDAVHWGIDDSVVRDNIYAHLKKK